MRCGCSRVLSAVLLGSLVACGGSQTSGPTREPVADAPVGPSAAPEGPLPEGVRPTAYRLELVVVPEREGFSGSVEIDVDLDRRADRLWIHGAGLDVSIVEVATGDRHVPARWEPSDVPGVAALVPEEPLAPGRHTLHLFWSAAFDTQLKGLYAVHQGQHYAFTQMEPTSARYVFPCFDEPRFKTPFEVTLVVRERDVAAANAPVVSEAPAGDGLRRVRFAPTPPLPTYLVAMAVGPFDVVEADGVIPPNAVRDRPVRLRGLAAMGHGGRLRGSLRETPALLEALESYFGIAYPYAKLDIVAVPDFASGAMENAGLVTFRESLLLWDEDASESQRRAFTYVMAHELAHQWFGNLVTMPWWDDIWLNEAFATWMGHRVVDQVRPEQGAGLALLSRVQQAMGRDSLASARSIRQPIETSHDIRNAFDPITYSKGGGVLAMAERWLGEDVFQAGLRRYMERHRWGTATADDLLRSLDEAAGRDVAGPLRTFLFQSGVPTLDVVRAPGGLRVTPRRYLPLGSRADADRSWQVPACFRWGQGAADRVACELVGPGATAIASPEGGFDWVMPNAGAAGYFRYHLPPDDTARLFGAGWPRLEEPERVAAADALLSELVAGEATPDAVVRLLPTLAEEPSRHVASLVSGFLATAIQRWADPEQRPSFERYAQRLFRSRWARLGWSQRPDETGETRLFRRDLAAFLALDARAPDVRREAERAGLAWMGAPLRAPSGPHAEAVAADLRGVALAVAVETGDAARFDALLSLLRVSSDAVVRAEILAALGHTDDPALGERALSLALDATLRGNEVLIPIETQMSLPSRRGAAWEWLQAHFDELLLRVATTRAGRLPWLAGGFCSGSRAAEVEAFFAPRVESLAGGPRNLEGAVEGIRLCAAQREAHLSGLSAAIASRR